jgi:hypothetical protein
MDWGIFLAVSFILTGCSALSTVVQTVSSYHIERPQRQSSHHLSVDLTHVHDRQATSDMQPLYIPHGHPVPVDVIQMMYIPSVAPHLERFHAQILDGLGIKLTRVLGTNRTFISPRMSHREIRILAT